MTGARRQRKPWAIAAGFGLIVAALAPLLLPAQAATTQHIVTDEFRGLALSGFDPVGYFTDSKPLIGRGDMEYSFGGAVWRFRNEGNRAAFVEHPEVYAPVFGGYDPVALARGVASPGHPQIWAIVDDRLYLFYSPEARKSFTANPDSLIAAAERKWPSVRQTLSP